jgi:hypothetical protein
MLDKMETGHGHLGGSVEHLEGKGGESAVAIPVFYEVAPVYVSLGPRGWYPWASIECTDRMPVI